MADPARCRLAASVVVRDGKGRVLVVREGDPRVCGKINLPGGHVDPGEELAACAVRECREETGLSPALSGLLGVCTSEGGVNAVYLASVAAAETTPGEDILECLWLTPAEIESLPDAHFLHVDGWLAACAAARSAC